MAKDTTGSAAPHPVDVHVGDRLRRLRSVRRITQQGLGEALGISFQQVQKYEKGTNRLSASKMFEIMQMFGAGADYFFDGLQEEAQHMSGFNEAPMPNYEVQGDGTEELVNSFKAIGNAALKKQILELVKLIAEDQREPGRLT